MVISANNLVLKIQNWLGKYGMNKLLMVWLWWICGGAFLINIEVEEIPVKWFTILEPPFNVIYTANQYFSDISGRKLKSVHSFACRPCVSGVEAGPALVEANIAADSPSTLPAHIINALKWDYLCFLSCTVSCPCTIHLTAPRTYWEIHDHILFWDETKYSNKSRKCWKWHNFSKLVQCCGNVVLWLAQCSHNIQAILLQCFGYVENSIILKTLP